MLTKWENMFQNWTTPKTASETLKLFYVNKSNLLSKSSNDFFWKTNRETITGENRIRTITRKNNCCSQNRLVGDK